MGYSEALFKELKSHKNVKLIFYIYDQLTQYYSERILRMTKYADLVICTIPDDCKKYGFDYFPLVYPTRIAGDLSKKPISSDVYFLGSNGGRIKYLTSIYEYLISRGVICDFNIVGVESHEQKHIGEITYNNKFSTEENLLHSSSTNCILEIMHEGMNAVTSRFPEALCLNKKLLTNNKNVVNEKYFDPRYIKVFENIEDIDAEWIKKREDIDYAYKNDYSARNLIDYITKEFDGKELIVANASRDV